MRIIETLSDRILFIGSPVIVLIGVRFFWGQLNRLYHAMLVCLTVSWLAMLTLFILELMGKIK